MTEEECEVIPQESPVCPWCFLAQAGDLDHRSAEGWHQCEGCGQRFFWEMVTVSVQQYLTTRSAPEAYDYAQRLGAAGVDGPYWKCKFCDSTIADSPGCITHAPDCQRPKEVE